MLGLQALQLSIVYVQPIDSIICNYYIVYFVDLKLSSSLANSCIQSHQRSPKSSRSLCDRSSAPVLLFDLCSIMGV